MMREGDGSKSPSSGAIRFGGSGDDCALNDRDRHARALLIPRQSWGHCRDDVSVYFEFLAHACTRIWLRVAGYFAGARIYFAQRRVAPADAPVLPLEKNLWLLVGCIFGRGRARSCSRGRKCRSITSRSRAPIRGAPWRQDHRRRSARRLPHRVRKKNASASRTRRATHSCGRSPSARQLGGSVVFSLDSTTTPTASRRRCRGAWISATASHATRRSFTKAFSCSHSPRDFFRDPRVRAPERRAFRLYFAGYFAFRFFVEFLKLARPRFHSSAPSSLRASPASRSRSSRSASPVDGGNRKSKIENLKFMDRPYLYAELTNSLSRTASARSRRRSAFRRDAFISINAARSTAPNAC